MLVLFTRSLLFVARVVSQSGDRLCCPWLAEREESSEHSHVNFICRRSEDVFVAGKRFHFLFAPEGGVGCLVELR